MNLCLKLCCQNQKYKFSFANQYLSRIFKLWKKVFLWLKEGVKDFINIESRSEDFFKANILIGKPIAFAVKALINLEYFILQLIKLYKVAKTIICLIVIQTIKFL